MPLLLLLPLLLLVKPGQVKFLKRTRGTVRVDILEDSPGSCQRRRPMMAGGDSNRPQGRSVDPAVVVESPNSQGTGRLAPINPSKPVVPVGECGHQKLRSAVQKLFAPPKWWSRCREETQNLEKVGLHAQLDSKRWSRCRFIATPGPCGSLHAWAVIRRRSLVPWMAAGPVRPRTSTRTRRGTHNLSAVHDRPQSASAGSDNARASLLPRSRDVDSRALSAGLGHGVPEGRRDKLLATGGVDEETERRADGPKKLLLEA